MILKKRVRRIRKSKSEIPQTFFSQNFRAIQRYQNVIAKDNKKEQKIRNRVRNLRDDNS